MCDPVGICALPHNYKQALQRIERPRTSLEGMLLVIAAASVRNARPNKLGEQLADDWQECKRSVVGAVPRVATFWQVNNDGMCKELIGWCGWH